MDRSKIIIVDNNEYNIETISRAASHLNLPTTVVRTVEECVLPEFKNSPDILIIRVDMVHGMCRQIIRTLQNTKTGTISPIIVLMGPDDNIEDTIAELRPYLFDVIQMPINPSLLEIKLSMLLQMMKTERTLERQIEDLVRMDQLNQRMHEKIREVAYHDELTSIPNRRYLNLELQKYCRQSHRDQTPLSLLMLDLDNFKGFNDHFGHVHGDMALQEIARTIVSCCHRPLDFVGRYGGEEFLVILPQTKSEGAMSIAKDILNAIWAKQIPHCPKCKFKYLSVSIGVVTVIPDMNQDPNKLIDLADQAMYQAKKNGKNQANLWKNTV